MIPPTTDKLERVVLTTAVPESGLESGDGGTVVHVHNDGKAYEVEFVTLSGETAAVVSFAATQVRPVLDRAITHARRSSNNWLAG